MSESEHLSGLLHGTGHQAQRIENYRVDFTGQYIGMDIALGLGTDRSNTAQPEAFNDRF